MLLKKSLVDNEDISTKLNIIIPSSSINVNKTADTDQGTNKAVNKVSKSTNPTLSITTVLKNISHSESVLEPNKVSRSLQTSSNKLSLSDSQTVDFAKSASNPQTESKINTLTTTTNLHRVIFYNISISTIKTSELTSKNISTNIRIIRCT